MNHTELVSLLRNNDFTDGWVLTGDTLSLWEHDEDPPAPLTRPKVTDVLAD